MNVKYFLDSNVLIYAHTNADLAKQAVAQQLITTLDTCISTQVLQESANTFRRKLNHDWAGILKVLREFEQNNQLHINTTSTIQSACQLAERYGFSFYDSLILAAALESGCTFVYSEDMQHGQRIENQLTILNPFLP